MTDRHKRYIILATIYGAMIFGGSAAVFLYLHELGWI
jgi:hypothetical protein